MDPISAVFVLALFKATEKIWEKGFDAAWAPVDESLKARFSRWAGKGAESQRHAVFAEAATQARERTLQDRAAPQHAQRILDLLDGTLDERVADAFADEAAKLMLFSARPDVPRLAALCQRALHFRDVVLREGDAPSDEEIAAVLADYLHNLREALLRQEPYDVLLKYEQHRIQQEQLQAQREIRDRLPERAQYADEETYRKQVAHRYRNLDFFGIQGVENQPTLDFVRMFVQLRLQPPPKAERERELGEREQPVTIVPRGIEQVLAPKKPLVVQGEPGYGKTTLLKYLTMLAAQGWAEQELGLGSPSDTLLPIYVPLRDFGAARQTSDYGLLDFFSTSAKQQLEVTLSPAFFEQALQAQRCIVCFDALDEAGNATDRHDLVTRISSFAHNYPGNYYIVTTRVAGYTDAQLGHDQFDLYQILPLTPEHVRMFVRAWYEQRETDLPRRERLANDLIKAIQEPRIQSLAQTPLLLTIIALIHKEGEALPTERVELYEKCVQTMLRRDEAHGLQFEERKVLSYAEEHDLLVRLAYELHCRAASADGTNKLAGGRLERWLGDQLLDLEYAEKRPEASKKAKALITLTDHRTGLLTGRGDHGFEFVHPTFREYLAARDILVRAEDDADRIWAAITGHLHDPHWREVILLLLGMLDDQAVTTQLVERILQAGDDDPFEPVVHRHLYLAARALADRVDVDAALQRRIVDELLKIALGAPDWERNDAFAALGTLKGNDYAAERLLQITQDSTVDADVRMIAAKALELLGQPDAKDAMLLLFILHAQDDALHFTMRGHGARTLGQIDLLSAYLLQMAQRGTLDSWYPGYAAQTLGQLGQPEASVAVLLQLARDDAVDARVRMSAAEALGQLGQPEASVAVLLQLARDDAVDARVRRDAYTSLKRLLNVAVP